MKTKTKRKTKTTALTITATPPAPALVTVPRGDIFNPATMADSIAREKSMRKQISEFIRDELREGIDFARIHVVKKDKCPQGIYCKVDAHWSAPSLKKAGSEKFCSLLQLTPQFSRDDETLAMIPEGIKNKGVLAFICRLVGRDSGKIISEGRGARMMEQDYGDINKTIKMAQKSAQTDAVLRLGLSDTFTQDVDDKESEEKESYTPETSKEEILTEFEKTWDSLMERGWKPPTAALADRRDLRDASYSASMEMLESIRAVARRDDPNVKDGEATAKPEVLSEAESTRLDMIERCREIYGELKRKKWTPSDTIKDWMETKISKASYNGIAKNLQWLENKNKEI